MAFLPSLVALLIVVGALLYAVRSGRRATAREREVVEYAENLDDLLVYSKRFALAARTSVADVARALDEALSARFTAIDAVALFEQASGGALLCTYAGKDSRLDRYPGRAQYALDDDVVPAVALRQCMTVSSKSGASTAHPGDAFALGLPLKLDVGNTSVLYVASSTSALDDFIPAIELLVEQAEPALLLAHEREELTGRATFDGLTGLLGRAAFDAAYRSEVERCAEVHAPLSLMYIDADGFKAWNDQLGHHAGDAVLQRLADILLQNRVSMRDLVCRRGGDEFVIALVDVDKSEAVAVAGTIAAAITYDDRTLLVPPEFREHEPLPLTASIGVATYPRDSESAAELLQIADRVMYAAKERGKDRVCYIGDDREIHEERPSESDRRDLASRPFSDRRHLPRSFAPARQADAS